MAKAEQLGREGQVTALTVRQVEAHRARLWIAEGNLHAVAQWAAATERRLERESEQDAHFVLFVRGLEERTLAWLYIAQGRYRQAIRLLTPYHQKLQAVGWAGIEIEVLAMQALALDGLGQAGQAIDVLRRALSLAEPEGYARTFIDLGSPMAALLAKVRPSADDRLRRYVDRLSAIFRTKPLAPQPHADRPAPREPPLAEPLTDREREVLNLVVTGLSNREIAEELVIALGTAKRHVSNIYAKLGVHSRVRAVAKARELRLV
jgi:LuxR family maltose regulon positive regulatory protein